MPENSRSRGIWDAKECESHDVAVLRLIQAGAVPNTTVAMITEWFRDWAGPLAAAARELM
jgi:hypothetical protein